MLNEHLKRRPKDADVRIVLARALERSGERAKALEAAERAVKDAGENLRIYQNAGQIAAELNDVERTTRWLTEYVKRVRGKPRGRPLARGTVAAARERRVDEARLHRRGPLLPRTSGRSLRRAGASSRSGGALGRQGRRKKRCRPFAPPHEPEARRPGALLRGSLPPDGKGPRPEALEVMNAALEAHPTDPEILYEAAMLAQETGDSALSEKAPSDAPLDEPRARPGEQRAGLPLGRAEPQPHRSACAP